LEAHIEETPRYAHLVALLFLGSAFVIFICVLVAAVAMISKSRRMAKFAAAGGALTGIAYVALLFAAALASRNTTISPPMRAIESPTGIPYQAFSSIPKQPVARENLSLARAQTRPLTLQVTKLFFFFVF